jgi:hypothetical protein
MSYAIAFLVVALGVYFVVRSLRKPTGGGSKNVPHPNPDEDDRGGRVDP